MEIISTPGILGAVMLVHREEGEFAADTMRRTSSRQTSRIFFGFILTFQRKR
jgi:hypothetical protein